MKYKVRVIPMLREQSNREIIKFLDRFLIDRINRYFSKRNRKKRLGNMHKMANNKLVSRKYTKTDSRIYLFLLK